MHNIKRRVMGSLMAVLMSSSTILGACPVPVFAVADTEVTMDAETVNADAYGLVAPTEGNILHAWDWKFSDVTKSMEDIANAGYSLVQVSPCQVCENLSDNNSWWKLYQPYDYKFGNSLGSADEFKAMCTKAEEYGVAIIVDVVANHMAGTGQDACGTRKPEVDSWWTDEKFHGTNIKFTKEFDTNREMMVRSNIGMPDVATEREDVQGRMIDYLKTMLDMGADGFRYDAAKHIGTTSDSGNSKDTFWKNISDAVAKIRPDALVYGEVLNGMPVSDKYYVNDGIKVTESQKGWDMKDLVQGGAGKVSQKTAFTYTREASADKLITWVENHDTYLNHWGSTGLSGHANYMSDADIILAWSTVGARADAQALYFARPDGCSNPADPGNPDASNTIAGSLGMSTKNFDWKDKKVAAVNKFKNAMVGVGEETSTQGGLAIIKRGNKGVVVTNFGSGSETVSVSGLTGLKDGTYKCAATGKDISVSGGTASISVDGKSFVVLYDASSVPTETKKPVETPTTAPTATPKTEVTQTPGEVEDVKIIVSEETKTFEDSFEVTVKAENAAAAYYSYDGAEWKKIEGTAKVTVGKEKLEGGDQVGLYVHAFDKDGKAYTKECTYTKKAVGQATHKMYIRVKKSAFTTAPNIYLYDAAGKALAGVWPGIAMTADGDYWVFTSDSFEGAAVIFNDGEWQDPEKEQPGYDVTGYMEYDKDAKTVTKFTPEGTATGDKKPGAVPKAPEFVVATPEVTVTVKPATTPAVVVEGPVCNASVEDGTVFTSETLEVELTLEQATSGTYSVDGGPVKVFTDKTKVVLGQGKIADTDVVLDVTVTDGKTTKAQKFVYKKKFDKEAAKETQKLTDVNVKKTPATSAVKKLQSLFEVVVDAAQADATLSNDALASQYKTNTVGFGANKTITVDGDISDWSADMLISQGAANDDPRVYKGTSMHEVPIDLYALYGAYDSENLYLMWEMTNVQDIVAPGEDYPLSQGVLYQTQEVPMYVLVDTGDDATAIKNGGKMSGSGETMWGKGITTTQSLNRWICFNTKGGNNHTYAGGPDGFNEVPIANATGVFAKSKTENITIDKTGVNIKYGLGIISDKIYGINDAYGTSYDHTRAVGDVCDNTIEYAEFNALGHKSATMDFHYEMSIPLSELGTTESNIKEKGIGVQLIATFGKSAMDCLPYDVAMNDNADLDDTESQPINSFEKSDEDSLTTGFARIGKGDLNPIKTPSVATPIPEVKETPAVEVTATPSADATAIPSAEVTATPQVTTAPGEKRMVVNFGADKSAPQAAGTLLKLEAIPYDGMGACQYRFVIDDKVVQDFSEKATYEWDATAGEHTIQVTVADASGKGVVVRKKYTVEAGTVTPTEVPVVTADPTVAPVVTPTVQPVTTPAVVATATPEVTVNPTTSPAIVVTSTPDAGTVSTPVPTASVPGEEGKEALTARIKLSKTSPQKTSTSIVLTPVIKGGSGTGYKYTMVAELRDGFTKMLASNVSVDKQKSVTWKPTKAGTYTINIVATDSEGNKSASYKCTYVITSKKLAITKATVSKKTVKVKKTIKITAKGTAKKGTLKFKFVAKKGKKITTIKKYSTKKTANWKPKKAGKYQVIIYAKDGSGKVVSKKIKVTVKK